LPIAEPQSPFTENRLSSIRTLGKEIGTMVGGRNMCSVTTIGGLTVAVLLLLSGFIAAKGDELSDLRAREQALQQQLDELQGVPAAPGHSRPATAAPPGRPPVGAGSFPRSFLIPGTETSVSVGGSVQTNFGFGMSR
jgi:hypothetical protein